MELSDRSKVLILIAIFAVVVYFFTQYSKDMPVHNEGALTQSVANINVERTDNNTQESQETRSEESQETQESEESRRLRKKFQTRDSAKTPEFVQSSFANGKRGGPANLDKFFEEGHPLDQQTGFTRNAGTTEHASYVPGKQTKITDVDKFNADSLLPSEKNKDWFDDPYEATSVKNTHLINIYRPVGVNTIQTTLKNPSWDLRGSPQVPKFAVSPWMNSSYEPDTNLRNQSLCY